MDLRSSGQETQIREVLDRALSRINTCIPGIIRSFDSSNQTVTVSPAIKMKVTIDNVQTFLDLPPLIEVPLVFPNIASLGFAITFPVSVGDSCLIVFSQRAIDNWHERDGVQPPEEGAGSRHHDLTDAFAILAPVALPNAFDGWEENGIQIRNRDKSSLITLKEDSIEIKKGTTTLIMEETGITITGPVIVNGIVYATDFQEI